MWFKFLFTILGSFVWKTNYIIIVLITIRNSVGLLVTSSLSSSIEAKRIMFYFLERPLENLYERNDVHYEGLLELQRRFRETGVVEFTVVSEGSIDKLGGHIDEAIAEGFNLLISTSSVYATEFSNAAELHPNTHFLQTYHTEVSTSVNVRTAFGRMYRASYLAGIAAGAYSKVGHICFVGSILTADERRIINGFFMGARKESPLMRLSYLSVGYTYHPTLERKAAEYLLNLGCDIIGYTTESLEVSRAASANGAMSITSSSKAVQTIGSSVLISMIWDWGTLYWQIVRMINEDNFINSTYWGGIDDGIIDVTELSYMATNSTKNTIEKTRKKFEAGTDEVFCGSDLQKNDAVPCTPSPMRSYCGPSAEFSGCLKDEQLFYMNYFVDGITDLGLVDPENENFPPWAIAVIVVGAVIVLLTMLQLMAFYKLKKNQNSLKGWRNMTTHKLDLDSPVSKALAVLRGMLDNASTETDAMNIVGVMNVLLSSPDETHAPDLNNDVNFIDEDTNAYVNHLLQKQDARVTPNSRFSVCTDNIDNAYQPPICYDVIMEQDDREDETPRNNIRFSAGSFVGLPLAPIPVFSVEDTAHTDNSQTEESTDFLNKFYSSWDMDTFTFESIANEHPLIISGRYVFEKFNLQKELNIPLSTMINWLACIESKYLTSNSYHNALHATDVLHSVVFQLEQPGSPELLLADERLCLIIAAIVHDVGHPGRTNAFQILADKPLAILYNDKAVLENHHAALALKLTLESDDKNVFSGIIYQDRQRYVSLRKSIVALVLSTDISDHFVFVEKFKNTLSIQKLNMKLPDHRQLLQSVIIKLSDINNASKIFSLSTQWTDRIMKEFMDQGDEEVKLGLSVSVFMDRNSPNLSYDRAKCQLGFIDFIVSPLFEAAGVELPLAPQILNIKENRAYWLSQRDGCDVVVPVEQSNRDIAELSTQSLRRKSVRVSPLRSSFLMSGSRINLNTGSFSNQSMLNPNTASELLSQRANSSGNQPKLLSAITQSVRRVSFMKK